MSKEIDDMLNILNTYGWVEVDPCKCHYSVTLMYHKGGDSVCGTVGSESLLSALAVIYEDVMDDMLEEVGIK
jgi:hypothetical protein